MAEAVAARTKGDDYQARIFWLNACRLFHERSALEEISFDDPNLRYFDDVSLYYKWGLPDERGGTVLADHYQVKFHVDCSGSLTSESLIDPAFIGAKKLSLLERVRDFRDLYASAKIPYRLYLVSPWEIESADPLAKLISNQGGELRLGVLFDGGSDDTAMGRVRKRWRDHLNLENEGLREVVAPLRVLRSFYDLKTLSDLVKIRLESAGLVSPADESRANIYDDLIRKLQQAGRVRFSRDELQELCEREGLWRGLPAVDPRTETYGIRSFMRWAEHMEDETDEMLCLIRHFDNREIRDRSLWADAIVPEVQALLAQMKPGRSYSLLLDAHASISFLAGYLLPVKSGITVSVMQGTTGRRELWTPGTVPSATQAALWSISAESVGSTGSEVAAAISVTHDVSADVRAYVKSNLPNVGRILSIKILPGPGQAAIENGEHAVSLAHSLSSMLRTERTLEERRHPLHLFLSAPGGFVFFFGQSAESLGPVVTYEYDFDTNAPGAYQPAVRLARTA